MSINLAIAMIVAGTTLGTAYAAIHPQTDLPWSARAYPPPTPTTSWTGPAAMPPSTMIPSHRPLVPTPFPPL